MHFFNFFFFNLGQEAILSKVAKGRTQVIEFVCSFTPQRR